MSEQERNGANKSEQERTGVSKSEHGLGEANRVEAGARPQECVEQAALQDARHQARRDAPAEVDAAASQALQAQVGSLID